MPDLQASFLATKIQRLRCCARLLGRQLCLAARAASPHLKAGSSYCVAALGISRACDSAPTQVTAQGGCREGGRALLQGPHLFLQPLPLRESLWPALLQDDGCILLPIACRDKVCLWRVCIPLHTAGTVSLHGTPAPVVSTVPIADCRYCNAGRLTLQLKRVQAELMQQHFCVQLWWEMGGAPCHRWRSPQTRRWHPEPASRGWASHLAALALQQPAQTLPSRQGHGAGCRCKQ